MNKAPREIAEAMKPEYGYRVIVDDPNDVRNGAVLKIFESTEDVEDAFSAAFDRFVFGSVHDDRFGYKGHWYLAVCQKKGVIA